MVIAADGVNSFLAKEAGLYGEADAANYTLGVKETIALPREVIDERFGVRGDHGVDIEIIGCTGDVPGGGFVYTNLDTVAVGLVLSLPALAEGDARPEELLRRLKAHPAIAPLVEGGEVKEYSAHVIPEAGLRHDARARRRRDPGGRRRRRHVPGRRHLAGGRQLRHRLRAPPQAVLRPGPSTSATRPRPDSPGTAPDSSRASCWRTTAASAMPRTW